MCAQSEQELDLAVFSAWAGLLAV